MMRYGLGFAELDPFPNDQRVGVSLEDESVVEVPVAEECPECPPPECAVQCYGWDYYLVTAGGSVLGAGFFRLADSSETGAEVLVRYNHNNGFFFVARGDFCGHPTRIVYDAGTWDSGYTIPAASGGFADHVSFGIIFGTATLGSGKTGTFKLQINFDDLAVGYPGNPAAVWTDICSTVRITAGPAR